MLAEMSAQRPGQGRLEMLFEHSPGFMAVLEGEDHKIVLANNAFIDLVGPRAQIGANLADALPESSSLGIEKILDGVGRTGETFIGRGLPFSIERTGSTEQVLVDLVFQPLAPSEGEQAGVFVHGSNVADDRGNDALRAAHNKVLELAIADAPLKATLADLIRMVETASRTDVLGSVLLLDADGKHLHMGAAPSLPGEFSDRLDGIEIGGAMGSCGTAAYLGAAVFVADIATDPLWSEFKQYPLAHGLHACWSIPIMTSDRKVLGTFAMYHREPRTPTTRDLMLIDLVSQTAALIIDREKAKSALRSMGRDA